VRTAPRATLGGEHRRANRKEEITMRRTALVLLVLLGVSVAAFGLDPVDFGAVVIGQTKNANYTFTNSSGFTCSIQAIGFGADYVASSGAFTVLPPELPLQIAPGGSASWTIRFAPSTIGEVTATLHIRVVFGIFPQTFDVPLLGSGTLSLGTILVPSVTPGTTADTPSEGCACATEIAALESDLATVDDDVAAISTYLQLALGPSLASLTSALAALENCCDEPMDEIPSGPFPSEGGAKFQRFVAAHKNLTLTAASSLPLIQPGEAGLQTILDDAAAVVATLVPELDQVAAIVAGLSASDQAVLDTYVPQAAIDFMNATTTVVADPSTHPKLRGLLGETGQDVGRTVWNKVKIWIDRIPVVGGFLRGLMDDIDELTASAGDTLGIAGLLFQYELERKLDGIVYGLFGIVIPPNATESQLEELLGRITGDSILSRLNRLDAGLAGLTEGMADLGDDIQAVDERVREIERIVGENADELADIEKKVCCFVLTMRSYTQQMGLALYGNKSAFEFLVPDLCHGVTEADCFGMTTTTGEERTFDAIKPEIRSLEEDMIWVREKIEEILRRLGGGFLPTDETPYAIVPPTERPEMTVEEREYFWLAITKKIYVYAEDTFLATSASDEHEVHVVTPAFDLSGWVDLSELRPSDVVEIEILVNIDGDERHFMTTTFDGDADARLVYFDELTGGRSLIVGDDIKILFRQTASADDYATAVPIGYQFIVESQI